MRTHTQAHACARTRQLHAWPLFTGVRIKEAKSKASKNCFTRRNDLLMFPLENRGVFECSKSKTKESMEGKTAFTWQPYLICITVGVTDGTKKTEKRGEINKLIIWQLCEENCQIKLGSARFLSGYDLTEAKLTIIMYSWQKETSIRTISSI